jgi:L-alanine-DL-glutamate epimerase-like enolase superfamily enzyme
MTMSRRSLLAAAAGGIPLIASHRIPATAADRMTAEQLDRVASGPLLDLENLRDPVIIQSMEILRNENEILVRVRSKDGAEGVIVGNSGWLTDTFPIFQHRVASFLVGKDAREVETLLEDLLHPKITYKLQGLALWVCVAAAEMAILELLGRIARKSIGQLFGGVRRQDIEVYRASGRRGNSPEEEIDYLRQLVAETGASAVKFRVGGMMSNNRDSRPGRSEALIPMVRDAFGDDMTIYADSNSSYDAINAIRIGRMMEEHNYAFFEEPCRFDDLWETKRVADALDIPIAGGEQEFSLRRFRWTILNRALDVVQPDLHYFGGYIRSTRVALMAAAAGLPCTPHMSGWGLGYLNALHFMSYIPNAAAHMEFKGYGNVPFNCTTSSLKCEHGTIRVPTGPGFGIDIDPDYVNKARPMPS